LQLVPQAPQLVTLVERSAQVAPQLTFPVAHWQAPPAQIFPAPQIVPQAPQLAVLLARSTQSTPQVVCGAAQPATASPLPPPQAVTCESPTAARTRAEQRATTALR
jgi:hypothetical protein